MGDLSWRFMGNERKYINDVLDSGFCSGTSGNANTRLEQIFAEIMGRKFSITFNSGTTTLQTALEAFGCGYGDEVIVPALTVISCMNSILDNNCVPIFADVDPDTFLIDPEDIERKITKRTKVIMVVHLYGAVCNMTEIMRIANKYNLYVLEDSAQAVLAYHNNKLQGSWGDACSYSFENSKHLTCGDGGILTIDNEELGDKIRKLNCQGYKNCTAVSGKIRVNKDMFQNPSYQRHSIKGHMFRLPEISAAMALAQLERVEYFVSLRQKMGSMYNSVIDCCEWLIPQKIIDGDVSSYYTYAMRIINTDVKWEEFRNKFISYNGDPIYAAWTPLYREGSKEDCIRFLESIGLDYKTGTFDTICPNTEIIQPQLMQLTTNQKNEEQMKMQSNALYNTIKYFE